MYNYSGLQYTDNHCFTFNPVYGKLGKFELKVFDSNLSEINTIEIESKLPLKLLGLIQIGESDVLLFNDSRFTTLRIIGETGKELTKKTFEDKKSNIYKPILIRKDEASFYLARTIKPKKLGFIVECFDANLEIVWTYDNVPEKGRQELKMIEGNANGIRLLTEYRKSALSNSGVLDITGLDKDGKQIFNKTMPENDRIFESFQVTCLDKSMKFHIVSTFGKSNMEGQEDLPTGLAYYSIDADGSNLESNELKREEIAVQLMPYSQERSIFKNVPTITPLHFMQNAGPKLICTSNYFWKHPTASPGGTTTQASTASLSSTADYYDLDILVFDLSDGIQFKSKITKPYKQYEIKNSTTINFGSTLTALKEVHAPGPDVVNENQIIVKGFNRNFHYVNVLNLKENHEPLETRVYYGDLVDPSQPPMNITRQMATKDAFGPLTKLYYQMIIPSKSGYRIANYREATRSLQVSSLIKYN
jgi:hypothetical protein